MFSAFLLNFGINSMSTTLVFECLRVIVREIAQLSKANVCECVPTSAAAADMKFGAETSDVCRFCFVRHVLMHVGLLPPVSCGPRCVASVHGSGEWWCVRALLSGPEIGAGFLCNCYVSGRSTSAVEVSARAAGAHSMCMIADFLSMHWAHACFGCFAQAGSCVAELPLLL